MQSRAEQTEENESPVVFQHICSSPHLPCRRGTHRPRASGSGPRFASGARSRLFCSVAAVARAAATTGLIFIVTGEMRFEEGGKVSCLNYSAAADKLVCFPREEGDEAEKPVGGEEKGKAVGGEERGKAVEGGDDVEAKAEEGAPRSSTAEETPGEKTPPMVS